ncbi:MAG: glutathione S-transferase [Sulfitobacter sp.]|jgi:glutathione S-transferase|nr:glutathione S-transferase [Roseobacter sp.]PHR00964.1 MAG: glutathione S-transferase [Sulfitobacter sp.]|tara:strand:- start:1885 stop:2550 length:666 start_codon:yes stop_codon:yes gene_type:complete
MITLHHVEQTRSMRTLWLLHELDVPFEVSIHAFDKSLRDPGYLAISPAGRVPSLEIEGERMFETGAIAEYLCERFSPDRLGRMPGAPDRMAWLVWIHFAETISQHCAALTQQHVALREDTMRSPIVMKLEAARIVKCYDALEARLGGGIVQQDYLLMSGFTAADVNVGQAVYMARYFAKLDNHPNVAAWYDRITDREAFRKSLPKDVPLFDQAFFEPWPVE